MSFLKLITREKTQTYLLTIVFSVYVYLSQRKTYINHRRERGRIRFLSFSLTLNYPSIMYKVYYFLMKVSVKFTIVKNLPPKTKNKFVLTPINSSCIKRRLHSITYL